jgi:MOSC domain-containing protein YiiM
MDLQAKGIVLKVYVGRDKGSLMTTSQAEVQVTFTGFEGDRHAGLTMLSGGRTPFYPYGTEISNLRQVSIVSEEELVEVAAVMNLPELKPEWIGANLLVGGIPDLTALPPMTRLFFSSGVVLMAGGENNPCTIAGSMVQKMAPDKPGLSQLFCTAAQHRRGITAWVERPGTIQEGDEIKLAKG